MKSLFTFLIALLVIQASTAQIRFKKGYFIDNTDRRVACYIKDEGWVHNPESFAYKRDSLSDAQIASILTVKEFGILQETKYVRFVTRIDKSPSDLDKLTAQSQPVWVLDTLFLKTLVEGKASLYVYHHRDYYRFFYASDSIPLEQLVFKQYYVNGTQLGQNSFFRNQLKNGLPCEGNSSSTIRYSSNDLKRFFTLYNTCKGTETKLYETKSREHLRLKLMTGINRTSFHILRPRGFYEQRVVDFKPANSFTAGAELELLLSLQKHKWSIYTGASFHTYDGEVVDSMRYVFYQRPKKFEYVAIDVRFGPRYYAYLSKKSKLFFQLGGVFYKPIDVHVEADQPLSNGITGAVGMGYVYGRFSLEANWYVPRNLMHNYVSYITKFQNVSLLVGVTLF